MSEQSYYTVTQIAERWQIDPEKVAASLQTNRACSTLARQPTSRNASGRTASCGCRWLCLLAFSVT